MIINPFRYIIAGFTNLYSIFSDGVNEDLGNDSTNSDINFEYTSPFTYSLWAKFDTIGNTELLIARPNSSFNNVRVRISKRVTTNYIDFNLGAISGTSDRIVATTTTGVSSGVWYHIVGFWDGTNTQAGCNLYINGALATVTKNGTGVTNSINFNRIKLGGTYGSSLNKFNGNMDEVSVWNKALSGAEITELYNSGVPSNLNTHSAVTNLKAWWRMGDGATFGGSNWTIPDEIGTNDLTSTNMDITNRETDVP